MNDQLKFYGPVIACGIQCRECVMQALVAGRRLSSNLYPEVNYEDMVYHPAHTWTKPAGSLGIPNCGPSYKFLLSKARANSCGQ